MLDNQIIMQDKSCKLYLCLENPLGASKLVAYNRSDHEFEAEIYAIVDCGHVFLW